MYSIDLFDCDLNMIWSQYFNDKKSAIDYFNTTVKSHSSGLFVHTVKHIELVHDNSVIAEVSL